MLKSNYSEKVSVRYVAMYPCANRYLKKKNAFVYNAYTVSDSNYGRFNIEDNYELAYRLATFNINAMKIYGREEKVRLIKRAISYLNYFDLIFKEQNLDLLISSGDSRLVPQVLIFLARQYCVPIIFFEQGPFGTTTFDTKGVNANSSFSPRLDYLDEQKRDQLRKRIRELKNNAGNNYWRFKKRPLMDRLYDSVTLLYLYPPIFLRRMLAPDLQIGLSFWRFARSLAYSSKTQRNGKLSSDCELPTHYVVLILQVPVDAQLIEHSPYFSDFNKMVCEVFEALPSGYQLIIREHPQYKGRYSKEVYKYLEKNNIAIANDVPLEMLLMKSSLVVVNNSTVGLEALLIGKKVVALGRSIYSGRGVTFDFRPDTPLAELLKAALDTKLDGKRVEG